MLYRLARAYAGQGDGARSRELCERATHFNGLSLSDGLNLNYAFVRRPALALLEEL